MNIFLSAAYEAAGTVVSLLARVAPPSSRKIIRSVAARRRLIQQFDVWGATHRDRSRPLLWIHAPSVGEGLQARPVLELMRERRPDVQLVYTFFSPSAESFAASLAVDFAAYLPFDTTRNAKQIVRALQPTALVFAKLDLWPRLCAEAKRTQAKVGMMSATLSAGSSRRSALAAALLGDAYQQLDAVGAISTDDARRLARLGVPAAALSVTGDSRYDQVSRRAASPDPSTRALVALLRSERPTLVAGSTWPADERVLLAAWLEARHSAPSARLLVAPHEPSEARVLALESWATTHRLKCARLQQATPDSDVIVVDRVGVLGDLYALGTAAFVGGGFHAAGLHSVLEPAAFGVPVVFGPQFHNSRDAQLLLDVDGGHCVASEQDTADVLARWLGSPDTAREAGAHGRDLVSRGQGAAERSFDLVARLLEPDSD